MVMKITSMFLTAFLVTFNFTTMHGQPQSAVTAFVDVSLVPMTSAEVVPHQTVVVRGDRIVSVSSADKATVPENAVRIEGKGKFLMPGMGEMHGHNPPLGS